MPHHQYHPFQEKIKTNTVFHQGVLLMGIFRTFRDELQVL